MMPVDYDNYPIARSPPPDSGPQIYTQDYPDRTSRDKYFVGFAPAVDSRDVASDSATALPSPDPTLPVGNFQHATEAAVTPKQSGAKVLGLRRRDFWILVALLALVLLAAIAGGTAGGVIASRREGPGADKISPTTPTTERPQRYRAVAASTAKAAASGGNYQVVYQDLDTHDIRYLLVWGDAAVPEQNATLQVPPRQNSPLAMVTAPGADGSDIELHVYYLSTSDDEASPDLTEVVLKCPARASKCTTASNTVIDTGDRLGAKTQLAAVLLDDGKSIHVFFQAASNYVQQLKGTTSSTGAGWTLQRLNRPALGGSSLAAAAGNATQPIVVFYLGDNRGWLSALEYSAARNDTGRDYVVGGEAPINWDTASQLAACHVPDGNRYRIFYLSPSSRQVAGYVRGGTGGGWDGRTTLDRLGKFDGNIAAVAWSDEIRLIMDRNGTLGQNSLHGFGEWTVTNQLS